MKPLGLFAAAAGLILLSACATTSELNRTRAELNQKMEIIHEQAASAESTAATLKQDVDSHSAAVETLRKSQANTGADLTELREQVQQVRGLVDSQRKEAGALPGRASQDELQEIRGKLDQLSQKVNFLETFLAIGEKSGQPPEGKASKANEVKPKASREDQYATAYASFKEGKYEKARTEFQNYLAANPKTSYADNAQYWIGETYFFEKKYEKAILEYDKVIKNYPEGNRTPNALFKQGLCFSLLGDKANARLIYQQVITKYPNTTQARTARAKLLEIK